MIHKAQADVEATGSSIFQEDEPISYLGQLLGAEVEFIELRDSGFGIRAQRNSAKASRRRA